MGRTHDYHCRNCHDWVNGFFVDDGGDCGCANPDMFYDLNHEADCCAGAVARLVGREERADGTVLVSFRITDGTIPSGPKVIGRHFELVPSET